jgi:hypothetical protein
MKYLLSLLCVILALTSCRKHKDSSTTTNPVEFKGITVINDYGQVTGEWGTDDGDWQNDATWSSSELQLLNFPDTVSLTGTFVKDTVGWNIGPGIHEQPRNSVIAFPNPAVNQQILSYYGLGYLKFKATIVDKYFNRLFTYSSKDHGRLFILDLSDSTKFQNGVIYRLYYSFSAADSVNFYKGHGDILICRESSLQSCRHFVP